MRRTTEIYSHLSDDPLRQVADRTAARIAEAFDVGAGQARPGGRGGGDREGEAESLIPSARLRFQAASI
jgi:hypothetical protein